MTNASTKTLRTSALLYLAAAAIPIATFDIGMRARMPVFVFEHLVVLFIVAIAMVGGRGPAVVLAVSAALGDNVLLREPSGRPTIDDLRDVLDLLLFMAVAVSVGWLVAHLRAAKERAVAAVERERQANDDRDRLIAAVTHDLATPLNAIQGTVQFARAHGASSQLDYGRVLARVETAAARATSLIRTLRDSQSISRHEFELVLQTLDVRAIVEPIATMMDRMSDRHPIALAMDEDPLFVRCDPERLGRVVENLIANAIKYSPSGGSIELSVRGLDEHVLVAVRDHGIGISPDSRELIFTRKYREPRASTIAPGLGLGLHIASEIVKRHGGRIDVQSEGALGAGSLFTVRLPRGSSASSTSHRSLQESRVVAEARVQ